MKARYLVTAGALALAGIGWASPAQAVTGPPLNCWTTTSTLGIPTGRDDSAFAPIPDTGGVWAKDTFVRTTQICQMDPPPELKLADTASAVFYYHANVSDSGTFVADHNPATGAVIPETHGAMVGHYSQDFTSTQDATQEHNNHDVGDTFHFSGSEPASTTNWVKFVWGTDDFNSEGLNADWSWTYTTCDGEGEQWVDAQSNNAGDPASGAGAITGAPCQSPSPSPSTSPSSSPSGSPSGSPSSTPPSSPGGSPSGTPTSTHTGSPSSSPSTTAHPSPSTPSTTSAGTIGGGGNLPTTGSKTLVFVGGGAVLILIGGALWLLSRKRFNEYGDSDEGDDSTQVMPQV